MDKYLADLNFTQYTTSVLNGNIRNVIVQGVASDLLNTSENITLWQPKIPYPFPAAAGIISVASDNAADSAAGTGGRTITVQGLTEDFTEVSQTVTLNGTTPVPLPTPLYRINGAFIATAGSSGSNVGAITISHAVAGTVGYIGPIRGFQFVGVYTVPKGFNAWFKQAYAELQRVQSTNGVLTIDTRLPGANQSWQSRTFQAPGTDGGSSRLPILDGYTGPFPEGLDVRIRVISISANGVGALGLLQLVLQNKNPNTRAQTGNGN